jgi:hypothetical protein
MLRKPTGRTLISMLAVGIALLACAGLQSHFGSPGPVAAEVRTPGSPGHFKSGGERSVVVLQEILATLQQMDKRLERVEEAVLEMNQRDKRAAR